MKKILVAAAALVWAGSASAQLAGSQHHASTSLSCSECHVMHASRQHSYSGSDTSTDTKYNQGTGHAKLLVADGTNATCLACHDQPGTNTDVFGPTTSTLAGRRSGGALNGTVPGTHDSTGYAVWAGHTLGSAATPPGWDTATNGAYNAGTEGFNCSLCHAVHGGAGNAFRNLGGSQWMGPDPLFGTATNPFIENYPTFAISAPAGVIDTTADVTSWASGSRPAGALSGKDVINVVYGKGSGNAFGPNGMNRYCAVCHGNFHGASVEAGGEYLKHPTTGSPDIVARMTTGGAQFNVTRPVYLANDRLTGEVGCLTCHKAHGNTRAFGLIWPANGTAEVLGTTNYENGDGTKFQTLCATCHPQAIATALAP